MTSDLDRLCEAKGIALSYISETGEHRLVGDDVKRALLDALGQDTEIGAASRSPASERSQCFIPSWLTENRAWGVTVQLYGVRTARNHGIGDFEDGARLAELFGPLGADFLGINPVHALFMSDPSRTSPYFPSSRQFLNPLYIALDRVGGATDVLAADEHIALKAGDHIDYVKVTQTKRRALEAAFAQHREEPGFTDFCGREGAALDDFATFEALSEWLTDRGHGAGWHCWPAPFQSMGSDEVAAFREEHEQRVRFHKWLQWLATEQLAEAQCRARTAGMRIGLYLDLAVGVAPDGAATWAQPDSYARGVRIGAPPDLFNSAGQDWGLAPLKPSAVQGAGSGFARDIAAAMRSAGAVRIDHAMGLQRLYWIPAGFSAEGGGFVNYPLDVTLDLLAMLSNEARVLVIGEDLGTVAPGFREEMHGAGLFGYRVFYFEREADGRFRGPGSYDTQTLACVSTHDLPPLAGWWGAHDIETRARLGKLDVSQTSEAHGARTHERRHVLDALVAEGLASHVADLPGTLTDDGLVAVHAFLARTPCRLVAIQLEDLTGATEHVNLPGTDKEHRNWSLRLPLALEALADTPLVRRTLAAVAEVRPRPPA